ncbi:GDSL-type esterase/lipase family protein [Mucilaginibacter glaciei]|uniref:GDSL family lipase n=1 Tax=Mucilaginibacter glaciei TaxID=2772109 RepID=A0A926NTC2_9SPHI|nr:GDSL-type esterase/lipase family protein [Mucilaginibacter glaciei]MBD1393600.1 GDSL family lipase [Mucilaginibacter glaciei]
MLWYEDEIQRLEKERAALTYKPDTLFYGSSSIRQWVSLADDFKELKTVNLGFGGSTLAGCTWFFDRVMAGYEPERLIFYAGDNDLSDGRHPEELFIFFQQLTQRVKKRYGSLPCYFISLKPSISRWGLIDKFRYTNEIISAEIKENQPDWRWVDIFSAMLKAEGTPNPDYYVADGLHLNKAGYQLWRTIVQKELDAN